MIAIASNRAAAWALVGLGLAGAGLAALPLRPAALAQDRGRKDDPEPPKEPEESEQSIEQARELERKLDARNKLEAIQAIRALGELRTPTAREVLMKFIRGTSNSEHGAIAVRALGWSGNDGAVDFLAGRDGVRSSRVLVAEAACEALASIGDKRAIPSLIEMIKKGKTVVACAAIEAVVKLDPAADGLAGLLSSMWAVKEDTVRVSVAAALGNLTGPGVVEALIRMATRDGHSIVRENACRSLGKLAPPEAREPLREVAARDKNQEVRVAAEQALQRIPEPTPPAGEGK